MNTSAKGWKKERECRKILEREGWKTLFKSIRWRWGTLDFAGLFDSVFVRNIIKNQEPVREWLFVSNKHYSNYRKAHLDLIQAFKQEFGIEEGIYQVWVWHKPRWAGRGSNRQWQEAKWEIITI